MVVVEVRAQLTPKELLEAINQLDTPELDAFTQGVLSLQAQRRTSHSENEEELLRLIKQGMPASFQKRYRKLISKRQAETLSADEYKELLEMTEEYEEYGVKRLEALIQLAALRGTSLDGVMRDLNIRPQPYV